jgi:hypothetical protein
MMQTVCQRWADAGNRREQGQRVSRAAQLGEHPIKVLEINSLPEYRLLQQCL